MKKEGEQSYYISQLVKLTLLAFRDDWEEAFVYAGYNVNDAYTYAGAVSRLGIVKFTIEYDIQTTTLDTELFDSAINYLIGKFKL